jgi:hypothetical protein
MRCVIIEDKDAIALLDKLKLTALQENGHRCQEGASVQDIHRVFHFVVYRWLREQGFECVKL